MKDIYLDPKELIADLSTELTGLAAVQAEEMAWSEKCPHAAHGTREHVLQELLKCCERDIKWARNTGAKMPQFYVETLLTSTEATGWSIFLTMSSVAGQVYSTY